MSLGLYFLLFTKPRILKYHLTKLLLYAIIFSINDKILTIYDNYEEAAS